jgi:hypothetical protein
MAEKLDITHPLTYDWLNKLVEEIETLNAQSRYAKENVRIKMLPYGLPGASALTSIQMYTDTVTISIPKGKAEAVSNLQKFKVPFDGTNVMVLPAINFVGTDTEVDAFCWVTNISETGCIIKVRRLDKVNKNSSTKITVKYLAIGKPTT